MLAYMPPEDQAATLAKLDLKRATQNTISNLQELQNHLQPVQRNGYAWDLEENDVHIRCLAAPIWDHTGPVIASLRITGPVVRRPIARLRLVAQPMQQAGL